MKNHLLTQALNVSNENLEVVDEAQNEQLIEQFQEEAQSNPVDGNTYVEERLETEADVEILENTASQLQKEAEENGGEVTAASMESAVLLVNAIAHRYGGSIDAASLESANGNPDMIIADIRRMTTSLESAMNVSLEGYSIADLWDRLGILNREIPLLKDNISILKNYSGDAKLKIVPMIGRSLVYAFRVNGSVAENIPKAAADTAAVCTDLLKFGQQAIDTAKKAADIALSVSDWKDADAAGKAMDRIASISTPIQDIYRRFDETYVLNNRRLNVKKFQIKGAGQLKNWSTGASLNVSWPKVEWFDLVFDPAYVQIAQGARKRNIKIEELVSALEKMVAPAQASQSIRQSTPKKWQEHKTLAKRLSKDVSGSADAKAVSRAISEMDRLGWQCINGAFTIMATIIREINTAGERVAKAARAKK